MKDNNGYAVLTEDEKRKALEGARIIAEFCETNLGCRGCPFLTETPTPDPTTHALTCGMLTRPCCWTIPEKWQAEGDDNDRIH